MVQDSNGCFFRALDNWRKKMKLFLDSQKMDTTDQEQPSEYAFTCWLFSENLRWPPIYLAVYLVDWKHFKCLEYWRLCFFLGLTNRFASVLDNMICVRHLYWLSSNVMDWHFIIVQQHFCLLVRHNMVLCFIWWKKRRTDWQLFERAMILLMNMQNICPIIFFCFRFSI